MAESAPRRDKKESQDWWALLVNGVKVETQGNKVPKEVQDLKENLENQGRQSDFKL